jgi:hypothetical protein
MTVGKILTLWIIWASTALYVTSVAAWLLRGDRLARLAWTVACLLYLIHVGCAFQFYHHWSHRAAYEQTARQTAEVLGVDWGGGLYFNYVFTVAWVGDVIWWWKGLAVYRNRPPWIQTTIHTFFAFMFFNATVIFGRGFVRWLGAAAIPALALIWWKEAALRASIK